MGQKWVKNTSTKSEPRPFGMLKQVSLARFEPVVTCFGPQKIPWWRVMGHGKSKMGQKRVFPKVILDHMASSNKSF